MLQRIGWRISVSEALPALLVLFLGAAVSLAASMTSELWGARRADVRLTSGAPGKSKEFSSSSTGFGRFFVWKTISPTTETSFTTD